ncbi:Uncharacterized protein (Fragment) [Durusdinium trenchii]|uniref:Uncharacterized protein n=2 Tax=Durusdinium trenchii TaxID=1381693 RepID=A0ABP0QR78_9DINO
MQLLWQLFGGGQEHWFLQHHSSRSSCASCMGYRGIEIDICEDAQDAKKHASELAGEIEKAVTAGQNVLIPFAQEEDLPLLPIRGTPFEKLMVATLQNTSMIGVYAVHAEPGAGKSTAAALAALELLGRETKDIIVLLQNDFERQLKSFLPMWSSLQKLFAPSSPF